MLLLLLLLLLTTCKGGDVVSVDAIVEPLIPDGTEGGGGGAVGAATGVAMLAGGAESDIGSMEIEEWYIHKADEVKDLEGTAAHAHTSKK